MILTGSSSRRFDALSQLVGGMRKRASLRKPTGAPQMMRAHLGLVNIAAFGRVGVASADCTRTQLRTLACKKVVELETAQGDRGGCSRHFSKPIIIMHVLGAHPRDNDYGFKDPAVVNTKRSQPMMAIRTANTRPMIWLLPMLTWGCVNSSSWNQ